MRAFKEIGPVAPATGQDVFDIEDRWTIARLRVPNIQPLVRAVVLGNLGRAQRFAPREVGNRIDTVPVVKLHGKERGVVVREAEARRRIDRCRL